MTLSNEQRRALAVLADTGRDGAAEAIMAARFGIEVLAGLVRRGLASVDVEPVRAGRGRIEVVRMKITDAGISAGGCPPARAGEPMPPARGG